MLSRKTKTVFLAILAQLFLLQCSSTSSSKVYYERKNAPPDVYTAIAGGSMYSVATPREQAGQLLVVYMNYAFKGVVEKELLIEYTEMFGKIKSSPDLANTLKFPVEELGKQPLELGRVKAEIYYLSAGKIVFALIE